MFKSVVKPNNNKVASDHALAMSRSELYEIEFSELVNFEVRIGMHVGSKKQDFNEDSL